MKEPKETDNSEQPEREELLAENRRLREALWEQSDRLWAIAGAALDSIFCKDLERRYTFVNPAMCRLMGCGEEDLLGKTPEDLFDAKAAATIRIVDEAVLKGEEVSVVRSLMIGDLEHSFHTIQVPMRDSQGRIVGVTGIVRDVTETLDAARRLRESEERYRNLVESSPIGIVVHSAGQVQMLNNEAIRLFGFMSEEDAIGSEVMDFIAPEDRERAALRISDVYGGERRSEPDEFQMLRRDGSRFWATVSGARTSFRGRSGSQVAILDITRSKEIEQERERLESQLRQAHKLEALGRLAGGVAHDFNNLLTAIQGNLTLALREEDGAARTRQIDETLVAANRAAKLTRQLLAFGRQVPQGRKSLDVNELVRGLERMLRRLVDDAVAMETDLADDLPAVVGDRGQLEQVIVNLVLNACDAMPEGGTVLLATMANPSDSEAPGGGVVLTVSDTGVGMTQEVQERLFEPFFSTKSPEHGTGLGLATVYGVVEQHGGMIEVQSAPGEGASFKVFLPGSLEGDIEDSWGSLDSSTVESQEGLCILCVEDDSAVREVLARLLQELGHQVVSREDGAGALEYLEQNPDVDVLVTDMRMPGMDGPSLVGAVRRSLPELPVLYVSGYSLEGPPVEDENGPPTGFVAKPFTSDDLERALQTLYK